MRTPRVTASDENMPPMIGLCAICRHARRITSDRGSVFVMCGLSKVDPAFPKYPPLPVLSCSGFDRIINSMPHIEPARLKPGVTVDQLPEPEVFSAAAGSDALVTGKALILWDPKVPGKKRDAIDTDQITPA